jgi:asparaginyl-tRNA synthetase
MKSIMIKSLYRQSGDYIGKEITVAGWVRTIRDSKTFGFIEVNDGSFFNFRLFFNIIIYLILRK